MAQFDSFVWTERISEKSLKQSIHFGELTHISLNFFLVIKCTQRTKVAI